MSTLTRNFLTALSADASLEAIDSTQGVERELVYYALVDDFETLVTRAARSEEQSQWELKSPLGNGRIRCRCSHGTRDGAIFTDFVMTTKIPNPDGEGDVETEQEVSEDIFTAFKALAPAGMQKTRYYIPFTTVDGIALTWEIDVFPDPSGTGPYPWVKIDLELPENYTGTTQFEWPIPFKETLDGNRRTQSAAEVTKVQELYNAAFIITNTKK